jgi:transposase
MQLEPRFTDALAERQDTGGNEPMDFRKGHDGLAALVQSALGGGFTGTVFVFRAKRADRMRGTNFQGAE